MRSSVNIVPLREAQWVNQWYCIVIVVNLCFVQINPRISDDHRHYRPPPRTARMSAGSMRHRINSRHLPSGGEQDMPEHDLRPPQWVPCKIVINIDIHQLMLKVLPRGSTPASQWLPRCEISSIQRVQEQERWIVPQFETRSRRRFTQSSSGR